MRWPWMLRSTHDSIAAGWLSGMQAVNTAHDLVTEQLEKEIKLLREERQAAENEAASLRGALVAERHAQGKPA